MGGWLNYVTKLIPPPGNPSTAGTKYMTKYELNIYSNGETIFVGKCKIVKRWKIDSNVLVSIAYSKFYTWWNTPVKDRNVLLAVTAHLLIDFTSK